MRGQVNILNFLLVSRFAFCIFSENLKYKNGFALLRADLKLSAFKSRTTYSRNRWWQCVRIARRNDKISFRRKFNFNTLWQCNSRKSKIMQNEYYNLIQELGRGKVTAVHDRLNNYSIEKLEKIAEMEWNPYLGETLFNMTMLCRKKKLNEQFEFNQENIHIIIRLDQAFKECCRQLKNEVESQFIHLLERNKHNPNTFHFFIDACMKIGTVKCFNSFLDCAHAVYDESLFNFSIYENEDCGGLEDFKQLLIFDFATNFARKLTNNI